MKIKAKVSFSGIISMARGSVRECDDEFVLANLLRAGYVEEVKEGPEVEAPKQPKAAARKRTSKKAG